MQLQSFRNSTALSTPTARGCVACPIVASTRTCRRQCRRKQTRIHTTEAQEGLRNKRRQVVLCTAAAADSSVVDNSRKDESPEGRTHPLALLKPILQNLLGSLWSILLAFALCDAAQFLVHRISSRLVNAFAQTFLSSQIDAAAIGNLWWMSNNPAIASFDTGYQYLAVACFLLSYPFTILLRTAATVAATLLCTRPPQAPESGSISESRHRQPFSAGLSDLQAVAGDVWALLSRIWQVDLRITVQALPLQAASLLIVVLPWSLPRLLALMLASPVAILEGVPGELAIERAQRLAKRVRLQQALPYLALLLAYQGLLAFRNLATGAMPPRFYADVPEIPAAAYLVITLFAAAASRALDLLPLTAYQLAKGLEDSQPGDAKEFLDPRVGSQPAAAPPSAA